MSLFWKILVFDEGTESADIATNANILLLSMGAIVIRTRYDEGTESAEVATSVNGVGKH